MPLRTGEGDSLVVAEHVNRDHGQGFALGRIDLARHDRGAGLVFGDFQFANSGPWPARVEADVVGDFHERAGERAQRRAHVDHRVIRGQGREFVARRGEWLAGRLREFARDHFAKTRVGVEASADRRSADRQRQKPLAGVLYRHDRVVELRRPARNRLAKRQRRCVLHMRSADHHHIGKGLRLGVERVAQLPDGRQQRGPDLAQSGDMHHGREDVVRRLTVIDVVIRMDRFF